LDDALALLARRLAGAGDEEGSLEIMSTRKFQGFMPSLTIGQVGRRDGRLSRGRCTALGLRGPALHWRAEDGQSCPLTTPSVSGFTAQAESFVCDRYHGRRDNGPIRGMEIDHRSSSKNRDRQNTTSRDRWTG